MHSWEGDPRPEPVQEYGTIRPNSRVKLDQSIDPRAGSWRILFAVAAGILLAVFFATGNARAAFEQVTKFLTLQGKPEPASPRCSRNTRSRLWIAKLRSSRPSCYWNER